eukprot:CAMPEP_0115827430 /NCGR_PEP_ID=MMETSP0287-20121206/41_1 /TAXON_ID=412157 /ORGANISM="Chrysochromulina rotalis, Strain UIO044" /LENGTH=255 /DNA_ID=CAMNT_0003280589 /DNA_START=345 /DNA_END=1109 /DNA_ORIENTATION=+
MRLATGNFLYRNFGTYRYWQLYAIIWITPALVVGALAVLTWRACEVSSMRMTMVAMINTFRVGVPLCTVTFCAHQYWKIHASVAQIELLLAGDETQHTNVTKRLMWRLTLYLLAYGLCQGPSLICNALALVSPWDLSRSQVLIAIDFITLPFIGVADACVFVHHALRALPNDPHPDLGLLALLCCDRLRDVPKSFSRVLSTGGFEPAGGVSAQPQGEMCCIASSRVHEREPRRQGQADVTSAMAVGPTKQHHECA